MDRINISESELLEALQKASDAEPDWGPEDAHTTTELARAMDLGPKAVRGRIKDMMRQGLVECVEVRRPAMDGRLARVPAYRFVGEQGAAA